MGWITYVDLKGKLGKLAAQTGLSLREIARRVSQTPGSRSFGTLKNRFDDENKLRPSEHDALVALFDLAEIEGVFLSGEIDKFEEALDQARGQNGLLGGCWRDAAQKCASDQSSIEHAKTSQPGTPGSETDKPSQSSELTKSVYADFAIVRRQSDVRLDARLASVEIHDGQPSPDEPPEIWLYVDLGTVKTDGCRLGFRNWIVSIQFSDTRMSADDETRFLGAERFVFRDGARIETSGGPNTPQWSFETTSRTEPLGASFRPAHSDGELRPLFHLLGGRKGQWVRAILRSSPKDIVVMDEEPEGSEADSTKRVSRAESHLIAHLNKMERFEGLFEEEHGIIATNQLDLVENDAE